jgi:hypothetical protein
MKTIIQKIYDTALNISMWSCEVDPDPNAHSLSSSGIPKKPIWLRRLCFKVFGSICIWVLKHGAKPPGTPIFTHKREK